MVVSFVPMAAVDERTGTITGPRGTASRGGLQGFTSFEDGDVLFAKITPCMENAADTGHGIGLDLRIRW